MKTLTALLILATICICAAAPLAAQEAGANTAAASVDHFQLAVEKFKASDLPGAVTELNAVL
ncbi:MAG: hypothetical protein ACYC08_10555, partial [Armatimonadota bacterium]